MESSIPSASKSLFDSSRVHAVLLSDNLLWMAWRANSTKWLGNQERVCNSWSCDVHNYVRMHFGERYKLRRLRVATTDLDDFDDEWWFAKQKEANSLTEDGQNEDLVEELRETWGQTIDGYGGALELI